MEKGGLVPVHITLEILHNAMKDMHSKEQCTRFLVDGFPREMVQIVSFNKKVGATRLLRKE